MLSTPIPSWLLAMDARKPYREVLDGQPLLAVSPHHAHGQIAVRIGAQLDAWAEGRGAVGAEVRFSLPCADGTWSSLLPDVSYTSFARLPHDPIDAWQRPRIAPDLAVEIVSPGDRPAATARKVATYLEHGATVVVVLHPETRRVVLHGSGWSGEERVARGSWELPPFAGLVLDWERIYRDIVLPR